MSKMIPLTQGKFAIVDDSDYEMMLMHSWYAYYDKASCVWYARRTDRSLGDQRSLRMHRVILGVGDASKTHIHHIDNNGLNNTRKNLVEVSVVDHQSFSRIRIDNSSGFVGVYFYKPSGRWKAQINMSGKRKSLGYFDCVVDAAVAYDNAAEMKWGKRINKTKKEFAI